MTKTALCDVVLFDLDGVIYAGARAIDYAPEVICELHEAGVRCMYITNNASRTASEIAEHLCQLGITTQASDVVTSSQSAVYMLRERVRPPSPVLVVGSDGLRDLVEHAGFTIVTSADERPAAVIQGFDPDCTWRDFAEASYAVRHGALWIATNPDLTMPTDRGIAPGNGSFVAAVATASGRTPDVVAGKPKPDIIFEAIRRSNAQTPIMVGDRLDTDIAGGQAAQIPTVLVLTGVHTQVDIATFGVEPTYVVSDLRGLLPLVLDRLGAGGQHVG
jgi:glycerol-1-phosphatase